MDYLEGLFLGTLWSDTDFENRRHFGLFFLYGFLVAGLVIFSFLTGKLTWLLSDMQIPKLVILMALFLASPFMHFRYYRFPLWAKIPVLLAGAFKYVCATFLMTTFVMPYTKITFPELQENMIGFLNQTLETATERFSEAAGTFSTVLGVITGGIYVMFLFLFSAALAILIPGTLMILMRLLQHGYDKLVATFILGNAIDR